MTIEFKDLIGLIDTIVWPIVVVMGFLVFRKPFISFLKELGRRATKFSALEFSVELSKVPEWSGPLLNGVRQPSPAAEFKIEELTLIEKGSSLISSGPIALFDQRGTITDYAIIDLGVGTQWLTSRLFIFSIIMERMQGLRCFVFLETSGDVSRRFLGTASPNSVRWPLASRYPWLEAAYANAYSQISNHHILSVHGALESWDASNMVGTFLTQIQQSYPPTLDQREWVSLGGMWERANWVDAARLKRT